MERSLGWATMKKSDQMTGKCVELSNESSLRYNREAAFKYIFSSQLVTRSLIVYALYFSPGLYFLIVFNTFNT